MKKLLTLLVLLLTNISVVKAQLLPPNIVLFVIDDASMQLIVNSLSFVHRKGIDSLLARGVRIEMNSNSPVCNPARGSMLTGMYAHNHGAWDNSSALYGNLQLFPEVLHNNGYNTIAYLGKKNNTGPKKAESYVDYQLTIRIIDYKDANWFKKNGSKITITGNTTKIISDTSLKWLSSLQSPFFLWIGEIAPHTPPTPADNKNLYKNKIFPLPDNFDNYTVDYPSFLYDEIDGNFYTDVDTPSLKTTVQKMHECMNDISDLVWNVRETLRTRGLLENTIIMLVGDNGYELGEHQLKGKNYPYRESVLVPCIIEYHPTITGGTTIEGVGAQLLDIPATLFDLANVTASATFEAQSVGTSIFDLVNNPRDIIYLRKIKVGGEIEEGENLSPSFRGIQTTKPPKYKYVRYQCDMQTEELFDLELDPKENTNVINNPLYAEIADQYRLKLDSMIIAVNDTLSSDTVRQDCRLIVAKSANPDVNGSQKFPVSLSPNPADQFVRVEIFSPTAIRTMTIYSAVGQKMESVLTSYPSGIEITTAKFPEGIYFIKIEDGVEIQTVPFVVKH